MTSKKSGVRTVVGFLVASLAGCGADSLSGPSGAGAEGIEKQQQALFAGYCSGIQAAFCDDFENGAGAWTPREHATSGDFTVVSNDGSLVFKQGNSSTTNTRRIATAGSGWADVTVEARIKVLSFNGTQNHVGLYARYSSTNTGYMLALRGDGKINLRRKDAGSAGNCINANWPRPGNCGQPVTPAIQTGIWYTLKFQLQGSTLTGYLNDVKVIESVDTTYAGSGAIGVGSTGGATFVVDNVVAGRFPMPATQPDPVDGATGVDLYPTLFWSPGIGATSHDIYFGTSPNPPFVHNSLGFGYGASYNPGNLAANTTYYWRVYERNDHGVTPGSEWHFTTAASTALPLKVAVYLIESINTCFIGDPCTGVGCVGLRNDANTLTEAFTDASFRAVRPDDPAVGTAAKAVCATLSVDAAETAEIESALVDYHDRVAEWSNGDIQLDLRLIRIPSVNLAESRWGEGVWIGPWDLREVGTARLDFVPDFNLVIPPIRDPDRQLHHDLGGCGGTFGADLGLAGAGWSWVPKTGRSFWFECAGQPVLTHEWLHQVHWGYQQISQFTDLYGGRFPACGLGDPDPHRWFPDSHQCLVDPDFERCGQSDCGSNDLVNSHILGAHWDPAVKFVSNTCKDGVQDWGESGVDQGGPCVNLSVAPLSGQPPVAMPVPAYTAAVPSR